jgi:hypothetical protein
VAVPLVPYLYSVENPSEVPAHQPGGKPRPRQRGAGRLDPTGRLRV